MTTDNIAAIPPPSTKHLTDEELKQQYGIHLTSRLQADAEGKEAKWADIDDDEDDWAPETIEWNDGTKTTLTAADLTPVTPLTNPDAQLNDAQVKVVAERPKPPQFTSSVGPNATVLKIGANAEKQQAQKAAAEKSRTPLENAMRPSASNVAPAPAPVKSPWAVLPPVDKASPIDINPQPVGGPPVRMPTNYGVPPPMNPMHAPSPAKEMSADDFNRTWKDGSSMQPRELYVPNSGRYEAVSDGRRRMSRNDQGFRAPAVLQRPAGTDHGPAEPSAAFQTTRTSSDATRRRASSIVSGGSGQFARRLSMKSGDYGPPVFDNISADLNVRPGSQDGPAPQPDVVPNQAPPVNNLQPPSAPAYDIEAERERQKLMMKENSAKARQRRLDEEARLEAEKRERIRQRLAALDATQPAKQEPETGTDKDANEPQKVSDAPPVASNSSQSPPKPPQPLATGEPQQYGMIKVHALDSTRKLGPEQRPFPAREGHITGANGVRPIDAQRSTVQDQLPPSEASPKLPKPLGGDARSGWGDLRDHRAPASNLWGVSSNKALGNGTFDQTLAGYAPQDLSRTPSGAPGWNGRTPIAGRSPHIPEAQLPLMSPDQGPLAADSEADTLFPVVPPAPIGRPHQQSQQANGGPTSSTAGNLAAWNNFHHVASAQERAESERYHREAAARREEEQRTGIRAGPQYTFNETWKQVQIGDQPTQRQVTGKAQSAVPAAFGAVGSLPSGPASRGSRFFPSPGHNQLPEERRAVTYSYPEVPRSPSPPPAEDLASSHPAFDGDYSRPAVRFPREKAVVRLPPAGPPTPPAEPEEPKQPLSWAARVSLASQPPNRSVSTPIAQTGWQERFNGLLGRHPDKAPVPPEVESYSRQPLEVINAPGGFSVSLPTHVSVDASVSSKKVEDEEDLFEDRELASLPTINLPLQAIVRLPLAESPSRAQTDPLDISSAALYMVNHSQPYKGQFAWIRLPNSSKHVKKELPLESPVSGHKSRVLSGRFRGASSRGGRGRGGRGSAKAA